VAEPWSEDFAALDARARTGLRSLEVTRASLPIRSQETQETKMRFFKSHPALAAALAVLVVLVGCAAYAVAREVWVSIDPDKSASEIERDVHDQLLRQGVQASVRAEKPGDGKLLVSILSEDSTPLDVDLRTEVRGRTLDEADRAMRLRVGGKQVSASARKLRINAAGLDAGRVQQLRDVFTGPAMQALLEREDLRDQELSAAIEELLVERGLHEVDVAVDASGGFSLTVKAPDAP
jgi:hypothetical protein